MSRFPIRWLAASMLAVGGLAVSWSDEDLPSDPRSPSSTVEVTDSPPELRTKILHVDFPELSVVDLAQTSSRIVHGRVLTQAALAEYGTVWTHAILEVVETFHGPDQPELYVRYPGGVDAQWATVCPTAPVWSEGDEVVAFLTGDETHFVRGLSQGSFPVSLDAQGQPLADGQPLPDFRRSIVLALEGNQE